MSGWQQYPHSINKTYNIDSVLFENTWLLLHIKIAKSTCVCVLALMIFHINLLFSASRVLSSGWWFPCESHARFVRLCQPQQEATKRLSNCSFQRVWRCARQFLWGQKPESEHAPAEDCLFVFPFTGLSRCHQHFPSAWTCRLTPMLSA